MNKIVTTAALIGAIFLASAAPSRATTKLDVTPAMASVARQSLAITDFQNPDPWTGGSRTLGITLWYPTAVAAKAAPYLGPDQLDNGIFAGKVSMLLGSPFKAGPRIASATLPVTEGAPALMDKLPTVIVSPGFGMPREFMSLIAFALASNGYLAVTVSHTSDAMLSTIPGRPPVDQHAATVDAEYLDTIIDVRRRDLDNVIGAMDALPLSDASRIAVLGHSYGGYAAVEALVTDDRVKAAVGLDSNPGVEGTKRSQAQEHGSTKPLLLIGDQGPASPRWTEYRAKSSGETKVVMMPGVPHMMFSDLCEVAGSDALPASCQSDSDPVQIRRVVETHVLEFLERTLR